MELTVYRKSIVKISTHFRSKPVDTELDNDNQAHICDFGVIIDNSMRKNAIICEM